MFRIDTTKQTFIIYARDLDSAREIVSFAHPNQKFVKGRVATSNEERGHEGKKKVSVVVSAEVAKAMKIQAARCGISKSDFVTLALTNPKKLELLQNA